MNNKRTKYTLIQVKAHKGKAIVIIHEDNYEKKIDGFLHKNQFHNTKNKSTDTCQKQRQKFVTLKLLNR
jgi:hypothetical protein